MKFLFLTIAVFLPMSVSAACTISTGPLTLPKEKIQPNKAALLGCINDQLQFISLEIGSTYSWVSMGNINISVGPVDKVSIPIASGIILPNSSWISISSNGKIADRGWISYLNLREYAKIENGIVAATTLSKSNARFPASEKWVLTPFNPITGIGKVSLGDHYQSGWFYSPNEAPNKAR